MLYEHSYVTNLETTAPQSDLTGAEKKAALLFWTKSESKAVIYSPDS